MSELKIFYSIITTTTYNRANTLIRLYESIKNQTFKNFEWIIGDDGSTDGTENLIKGFIKEAPFEIRYVKLKHRGKAKTWETIYNISKGEFILSVDSDDMLYANDTLKIMYDKINSLPDDNFSGVCGCFIDQNGEYITAIDSEYFDITKENFFDLWAKGSQILNNKWLFRKIFYKAYGHDEVKDFLPYFPEIIDFMRNFAESQYFKYRLFKVPVVKYYTNREDSVTVATPKYPLRWYETVYMINLFYEFDLTKKYKKQISDKIKILARVRYKEKGVWKTFNTLNNIDSKLKFAFYYLVSSIFSVMNADNNHKVITLLGIKIKFKKLQKR